MKPNKRKLTTEDGTVPPPEGGNQPQADGAPTPEGGNQSQADYTLEDHGSIVLLRPLSQPMKDWLRETAPEDAQFFGGAMAIEPRYVEGVIEAATEAGFTGAHQTGESLSAEQVASLLLEEFFYGENPEERPGGAKDMWRQGGYKPLDLSKHEFTGKRPGTAEKPAAEDEDEDEEDAETGKPEHPLKARFKWRPAESIAKHTIEDLLPGGLGDKVPVSGLDPEELKMGMKDEEEEHGPRAPAEIAADHLVKDPKYYTRIAAKETPKPKASFYPSMGGPSSL